MSDQEHIERIRSCADRVAKVRDADILLYNGEIVWDWAPGQNIIDMCESKQHRRSNVVMILVTNGGDPDAAYRIARCLQQSYDRFIVYISGYCKSAGTLITFGADEIIISDHGQLGPLDVQINKPDELFESGSGLDTIQALDFLQSKAFAMFTDNLVSLKLGSSNQITLKTATDISVALTTGLYNSLYEQIDPTRLGEISRAMRIAEEYGARLDERSKNAKPGALQKLVTGYPAHSFVIDRYEAGQLFNEVREPHDSEKELATALESLAQIPSAHADPADPYQKPLMAFISTDLGTDGKEQRDEKDHGEHNHKGHTGGEPEETGPTPGATEEFAAEISQDGQ